MKSSLASFRILLVTIAILSVVTTPSVHAAETAESNTTEEKEFPEQHWGQYYDPSNIFCGKYDCYKILGFDFETWGKSPPSKDELKKSYRTMSRKWHPDKNKDKGAQDRFMKINKAYTVLTDPKLRKEYDHMRERPDEYFYKYGSAVLYNYAPKSDTVGVVIFLLLLGCAFTWYAQKNRWQQVADRLVKDATEGLKAGEGGSKQSIEIRAKAEEKLKTMKEENGTTNGSGEGGKKSKIKLTKKELREKENEELRPIIVDLVNEIEDFGAGFHQPTWRDILLVRMAKWPVTLTVGICWEVKFYARRIRKVEYSDQEREVMASRAVGHVAWTAASAKDKEEMISREVWVTENLEEWLEVQEIRQLPAGQQKRYNRWKKKEGKKGKSD